MTSNHQLSGQSHLPLSFAHVAQEDRKIGNCPCGAACGGRREDVRDYHHSLSPHQLPLPLSPLFPSLIPPPPTRSTLPCFLLLCLLLTVAFTIRKMHAHACTRARACIHTNKKQIHIKYVGGCVHMHVVCTCTRSCTCMHALTCIYMYIYIYNT
jgi:hypothetical protein